MNAEDAVCFKYNGQLSGVSIYAEAIAYGMQVALSVDLAL
jgi:hypothetical protein